VRARRRSAAGFFTVAFLLIERSSVAAPAWHEQAKLSPSTQPDSRVGSCVATTDDIAIVGAAKQGIADADSIHPGALYAFQRVGAAWHPSGTILAPADIPSGSLGASCVLSGDELFAGATATAGVGAVFVYRLAAGTWAFDQVLGAGDGDPDDAFGASIAIDKDTLAVGAPYALGARGAVYVFTREGAAWGAPQKLLAKDGIALDLFGWRLALSGATLVASAPGAADFTGAAYAFTKVGSTWIEQQTLTGATPAVDDRFGASLSRSGDALAVGAPGGNAVSLFTESGGVWSPTSTVTQVGIAAKDRFGAAVSLFGNRLFASAPARGGDGSVFLFERTGAAWAPSAELVAGDAATTAHAFGESLAASVDTLLVGAYAAPANVGDAHLFRQSLGGGDACTSAASCVTGFCIDGVCCDGACGDGVLNDCLACSRAAGASIDGTCSSASSVVTCREARSACDQAERCDGVSTTCPADVVAANGTVCAAGGTCIDGQCSVSEAPPVADSPDAGSSPSQPPDAIAPRCGCRVPSATAAPPSFFATLFVALFALLARRRQS
jgi:MYXO-CTERM domain-containing protein